MSILSKTLATVSWIISTGAAAAVDIKNDDFRLALGGDWKQVANQDPKQFNFESKALKSSIVLSITDGMNIPDQRLVEVARKFMEFRIDAERQARHGKEVQFGDSWVKLQPSGDVVEIGYAGFDPSGTIFRFLGYVTQRKVVSFWLATESTDAKASGAILDEAFKGLKFYVP
jgi:hypothetical protein